MTSQIVRQTERLLLVSLLLAFLGFLLIPLDLTIHRLVVDYKPPGELRNLLQRAEAFGHGTGVILILTTVIVLCRPTLRRCSWMIASAFGAGLCANIVKLLVARTRPRAFDGDRVYDTFASLNYSTPLTTFSEHAGNSLQQSFPSAHTATAFGLALALAHLFPRGHKWFYVLASLVACQRVCMWHHYPSDVFCGAAVGLAFGAFAMRQLSLSEQSTKPRLIVVNPADDEIELKAA